MKNHSLAVTRRRFLQSTAAAGLTAPFILRSSLRAASPNGKLGHACIGVGGMGWADLQNFQQHPRTQIVALCDVDANNLKRAAEKVPGARTYADWRELLEKEGDKIDSVNVAVPDHSHFPIAMSAIQRGKHVYCQKPMCHDVAEVRALTEAAVRQGIVSQLGTQMASGIGDRTTVALLKAGAIGKIKHAYLCSNRPGAVEAYRLKGPRPAQGQTPPPHLSWDLWIGTAPMRPYAPDIYHSTKWRAWQDFGTGWSGDIGCHIFDAVWKGLDMKAPVSVIAEVQQSWKESSERRADTWPQGDHITWVFPGNELTEAKERTLEWFDGEFYPPKQIRDLYSLDMKEYPPESAMIVGTDGRRAAQHPRACPGAPARGEVQGLPAPETERPEPLPSFRRRVPRRREDRISFRADGSDDGSDPARHGGDSRARSEAGMGRAADEIPESPGSRVLPAAEISCRVGNEVRIEVARWLARNTATLTITRR